MILWAIYIFVSFLLSIILIKFVDKKILKILIFSFSFSLFVSIWYKFPGDDLLAPILSIFLIESTISQSNGFLRIFRPFVFTFITIFSILYFLKWKIKN